MSSKKRILFIATEISPFLELTEFSEILNSLAIKSNENDFEVRCIMPRYGVINERRHKLHEVVRLSGINVSVDNDDYPLQIKVSSLPNARLQVYFLDNDEFFKRKFIFRDEHEEWFEDNGLRSVFFCKGALETVKKFGWPPDIIHCSGWMTALIPMYIKTAYKKEPVFSNCKVVYSIGGETFDETLDKDFIRQANIHAAIKPKDLEPYKKGDYESIIKGGAVNSDAIAFATENIDEKIVKELSKTRGKKILKFQGYDSDLTEYFELFNELVP